VGGAKERRAVGSLRFPRRPRLPVTVCVGVDNSPHKLCGTAEMRLEGNSFGGILPKVNFDLGYRSSNSSSAPPAQKANGLTNSATDVDIPR